MTVPDLDLHGPAAPPRSNGELVFEQPWQRRLFATTMALCESDVIAYEEFRQRLIRAIETGPDRYWVSWQDALEAVLADHDLCDDEELASRAAAFAAHGSVAEGDRHD